MGTLANIYVKRLYFIASMLSYGVKQDEYAYPKQDKVHDMHASVEHKKHAVAACN